MIPFRYLVSIQVPGRPLLEQLSVPVNIIYNEILFVVQMLTRSRYFQPNSRFTRLQSEEKMMDDLYERPYYLSPQPSLDPNKLRYKFAQPLQTKSNSVSNRFSRQNSRRFFNQLHPIDRDISQLQQELEYKCSLKRHLEKSRLKLQTITPYHQSRGDQQSRLLKRKTQQDRNQEQKQLKAVWQNPDIFRSTRKKFKIYKLKPKRTQPIQSSIRQISEQLPVIDKIRFGRSRHSDKEYLYEIIKQPSVGKIYYRRPHDRSIRHYRRNAWLTFRKAAHVVLFTIYLRKFNERMRRNREGTFQQFAREEVKDKLLNLKNFLIEHSQPFFLALISQNTFDYALDKDDPQLKREKQRNLKQLIELQLSCIDKSIRTIVNREFFSQLLYYMCRHGNYACCYQMFTTEELSLLCISERYGYVSADRHLEQSALLSLVFMKILLFNIMLQPSKIPIFINYKGSTEIIFKNIRLIATILYELFIDIQDNLLQRADGGYTIGNWKKARFQIKSAQSMTVRAGFYQKNELISGLADHKYMKETYGTRFMTEYKNMLQNLVKLLHTNVVDLHTRIRHKYF